MDTQTDFNLNNIIHVHCSNYVFNFYFFGEKIHQQMSSNLIWTPPNECQSCQWASMIRTMQPRCCNLCALQLVCWKTIDLFSTASLESQESYLTNESYESNESQSLEMFFAHTVLSHSSLMLPPHQPCVFAQMGSLAIKWKRHLRGFKFGLTEMCFLPRACTSV